MKILVFGFKPYRNYKGNITEKIVRQLKNRKNLQKVIFPVKFEKKIFREAIEKYKPDVVLGLGMHPGAKKIRIERKAINLKKDGKVKMAKRITEDGPRYRLVNLKLKPYRTARVTYNAGSYVCNFCMYVISGIAEKRSIKFAFLHIPQNYNVKRATKFIEDKIDESPWFSE